MSTGSPPGAPSGSTRPPRLRCGARPRAGAPVEVAAARLGARAARRRRAGRSGSREIGERVQRDVVEVHLEVEVTAGAVAGAALVPDLLSTVHRLAVTHGERFHVAVHGDPAVAVDDDDVVTVPIRAVVGVGDAAVRGGDAVATRRRDVDAAVEVPGGAVGIVGLERVGGATESLRDRAGLRPREVAVAATGGESGRLL